MRPTGPGPAPDVLALERIEIRRMPGFRRGGFTLEGLSPGVNVIHGPNGVGKSTAARAIEALLWPSEACKEGYELFGRYRLGGASWTVELGPGPWAWQKNGSPAEAPRFPGETGRHRYRLSLTELLEADDRGFAEQIVRESAGGYDVGRAVERLGFGRRAPRYQAAGQDLRKAREAAERAVQEHERLRADELQLESLEAARREAAAAAEQREELDRQVALVRARADEARLRRELAAFPGWMGRLRGDEGQRLGELRAQARQAEVDLRAAEAAARHAEAQRAETGLPDEGVPLDRLASWRRQLAGLHELEKDRQDAERQVAQAQAAVEDEERRLGGAVAAGSLEVLGRAELDRLRRTARELEEATRKKEAVETELHRLGPAEEGADEGLLRQGAALLSRWLRAPDPAAMEGARRSALLAALAASVAGLLGALGGGGAPGLALGAAAVGLLLAWVMVEIRLRRSADPRSGYREAYEGLGLEPPARWTPEEVEARLEALLGEAVLAKEARRRAERRRELLGELEAAEASRAAADARRAAVLHELGLPPETSLASLLWLVERVAAWQGARTRLNGERARLERVEAQWSRAMAALSRVLEPLGYGGLESVADLAGAVDDLERRRNRWEEARRAEERAAGQARRAREEAARVQGEVRRLFQGLGLDPEDPESEAVLRRALDDRDRFRELERQHQEAVWRLKQAQEQVPEGARLEPASLEELLQAREEARARAAEEETYRERITATQTRIQDAKKAHALEEALAAREAAEERLRDLFHRDVASRLGAWLAGRVQEASRESERPQVFHRARRLLQEITAGRYSLELQEGSTPLFRALETETGEGRALDELSSGTRVQLLLAVRVAFVETLEQGTRLPLVFDEVLANSDDERAGAVIQAVIALARAGRQVFYFTAQRDEVARWEAALAGAGVDCRIIDLEAVRRGEEAGRRPLPPPAEVRPAVPPPDGLGYHAYGRLLQVPGIDPFGADVGGVHLWHLLDDPHDLYRLLKVGVERWGPLRALGEPGLEALLAGEDRISAGRIYRTASAAAEVLEEALRAWRVGRGRPVDEEALKASGAVSPTFLPRVARLAAREGREARRLLAALARGEIARFQRAKVEELRRYLDQEGYLDPQEPLDPEMLRARVLAEAAAAIGEGRLSREHVDRLIRSVVGNGGGPAG